jgi:iron complex outermembrane receptor protein
VRYTDLQAVGGVRSTGKGDFTWDLSGSYGVNNTNFYLNNSINASLGADSPHNFYLGRQLQQEFNLNADGVYRLSTPLFAKPINIAFGAERRVETYSIRQGDYASYAVGPAASYGLAAGASGFPASPGPERRMEPGKLCRLRRCAGAADQQMDRRSRAAR